MITKSTRKINLSLCNGEAEKQFVRHIRKLPDETLITMHTELARQGDKRGKNWCIPYRQALFVGMELLDRNYYRAIRWEKL